MALNSLFETFSATTESYYKSKIQTFLTAVIEKYKFKQEEAKELLLLWNTTNADLKTEEKQKKKVNKDYCIQITKEGKQCRNYQKEDSKYCSSHKSKIETVKEVQEKCSAQLSKGGQCTSNAKTQGLCTRHYKLKLEKEGDTKEPAKKESKKDVKELEEEPEE